MGTFDFALLREKEKEKKPIPSWAHLMRTMGAETGETIAEAKSVGKFDSALKSISLATIEQEEKELKDFETTYESLNASIDTDYNQYIDLEKQLEEIGLSLEEAPEELTWHLQKKFEEVKTAHNDLVDKIKADTAEQKQVYDSYTIARAKYEKDMDTYNRSASATRKRAEPFVSPDYSPETIAKQLKEGTYVGVEKPEPLRNVLGAYATFGKGLSMLPKALQVTFAQAIGGGQAAGINDTEEIDTLLKNTKDLDEFVKEAYMRYGSAGIFGIKITDLAELPQNLSYSIVSSGAGAAVGIPIALIPYPGMRALAWASGTAVSGLACYRATEFQITQSYLEFKNEESIRETGKPLNIAEERLLKDTFAADAKKYALWEAVPEALSNLNFWGTLAAPLTKTVGKSAAGAILNKLSRIYLGEFSTEMITQMGQSSIEARAGMRERGPMDWTNPRDYMEALREVAPQTFLLTTVMAGAGSTVIETGKAFKKITKSLKTEVGENNPLRALMEAKLAGILTEQRGSFSWKDLTKKEINLLAEEAKKYKSAEEFVKAQFETETLSGIFYGERTEIIKNPTEADYRQTEKNVRERYRLDPENMPPDELFVRELYDDRGNVYIFPGDMLTHEDVELWLEKKGIFTGEGQLEGAKEKEVKRLTALYNKVAVTPTNIEKAKEDLIKHGVREEFLTPEFMKKYMKRPAIQELEKADVTGLSEEEALEEAKDLEEIELSAEELVAAAKDVEPTADELDKIKKVQVAKEKFEKAFRVAKEKAAKRREKVGKPIIDIKTAFALNKRDEVEAFIKKEFGEKIPPDQLVTLGTAGEWITNKKLRAIFKDALDTQITVAENFEDPGTRGRAGKFPKGGYQIQLRRDLSDHDFIRVLTEELLHVLRMKKGRADYTAEQVLDYLERPSEKAAKKGVVSILGEEQELFGIPIQRIPKEKGEKPFKGIKPIKKESLEGAKPLTREQKEYLYKVFAENSDLEEFEVVDWATLQGLLERWPSYKSEYKKMGIDESQFEEVNTLLTAWYEESRKNAEFVYDAEDMTEVAINRRITRLTKKGYKPTGDILEGFEDIGRLSHRQVTLKNKAGREVTLYARSDGKTVKVVTNIDKFKGTVLEEGGIVGLAEEKVVKPKEELKVEPKVLGEKFVGKAFRAETKIPEHGAEMIAKMTTAQEKLEYDYGTTGNYTFKEAQRVAGELGIDLSKVPIGEMIWVASDLKTAEKYGEAKEIKLPKDTIILAKDEEGGSLVLKNSEKYGMKPVEAVTKPVSLKTRVRNDKRIINRLRDSIKRARETKEDVKTIKQLLHEQAKEMPLAIRGKMLTALKTAVKLTDLTEAIAKMDEYTETYYRKQYVKAIEKELTAKKIAPKKTKAGILKGKFTAEIQRVLDVIKDGIHKSRPQALAQIEQNIKNFEAGETTDIAGVNELLNMQGIKEMTLNDLESALDNIKTLKDTGKTLKAEKEAARKEALQEKVVKTVETVTGEKLEIDEETGKPKIDTAYKTILKAKWSERGLLNKAKKAIDKIMNWQFGWDNLLDKLSALDKTSKPYESELSKIGFAIQYARINQIQGVEEVITRLQDAFSTAYKVEGRRAILDKVAEHKEDIDLGTFKNAEGHKVELILNKEQLMKKYMQLEDPTLESTFTKGMLYTDEIKDAIRGAITEEDVAYINGLREIYDTIYEKVNPIYGELYGVDLPRNPHYSGRILREGKEDTNIPENLLQVENAIHYASVLNPSLKQRSRTLTPLKYNEATPDILRYVLQMEHFAAFAKPLQELRGIFGNSTVKAVIKQGFGSDIYRKVTEHLQDITRDGVDKSNVIAWVDKLRGNLVRSILAKPIIGIKQVPSILAYMTEMPTADFFKGIANFWKNPIKNYRTLMDLSPYAKERFGKGFERDIHAAMREGYGNTLARTHKFSNIFFTHIRLGDKLAVIEGMWAKMYSETGGKGSTASKAEMIEGFRAAERSTERTQPTYTVESLAAGQRGGSFLKLLTMFQNQLNKYYRIIADNARNFRYGRGSRIKAASNITLAWVVLPLLFQLIGSAGKIRDKDLYRILLLGPLNDVLVFAQMAKSIYGWLAGDTYDYQVSPAVSTMRELQKALQKVVKWKDPTKDMTTEDFVKMVEAASKAVGQLVGMPTPYGVQLTEAARAGDWRQILYSPYALREEEESRKAGPVDMDKIYEEMGIKGFKKPTGKIPTKGVDMNKIYEEMGIK